MPTYPERDFLGYGAEPPDPHWPDGARLALQIVLNYEEGAENSPDNGDAQSEVYLQEVVGISPRSTRDLNVESVYEYGARAGAWRLLRLFRERKIPLTIYGVADALQKNPTIAKAFVEEGHEIATHGLRWIDYGDFDEAEEERHLREAIAMQARICGERPLGAYIGRISERSRALVAREGGFLYSADSYADDLPYWEQHENGPLLIVPYTLDNNDMKFGTTQGFNTGEDFYHYLRDAFDVLYAEGCHAPKMMSVGLHARLAGRPGRMAGLQRFLDHVARHEAVWLCRRIDIAKHWHKHFPPTA